MVFCPVQCLDFAVYSTLLYLESAGRSARRLCRSTRTHSAARELRHHLRPVLAVVSRGVRLRDILGTKTKEDATLTAKLLFWKTTALGYQQKSTCKFCRCFSFLVLESFVISVLLTNNFSLYFSCWGGISCKKNVKVLIRAPRVRSDPPTQSSPGISCPLFQSTLPMWGATRVIVQLCFGVDFNPRSPCGERPDLHPCH